MQLGKANRMTRPVSIDRITKRREESLPVHAREEGQLTFATSGMVQIATDQGIWLVLPQLNRLGSGGRAPPAGDADRRLTVDRPLARGGTADVECRGVTRPRVCPADHAAATRAAARGGRDRSHVKEGRTGRAADTPRLGNDARCADASSTALAR